MSGLIVVGNPRRKRRATAKRKSSARRKSVRRNPARRRRPMTALQAKYFGKRHKSTHRRTVRRNPVASVTHHRKRRRTSRRYSFSGVGRTARRATSFIEKMGLATVLPASIGAAGALGLDLAWGYLPIPAMLQTGPLAPVVRLAGAMALGMGAGMFFGKKFGAQVTAGATVVTIYDLAKGYIKTAYPSLPGLQGVGWYSPGVNIGRPMGLFLNEYTPDYCNETNQDNTGIVYGANPYGAGADHVNYG